MKAVLVIDMPNGCCGCPCYCEDRDLCRVPPNVLLKDINADDSKPSWCPLRPLPTRNDYEPKDNHPYTKAEIIAYTYGLAVGRNQVIEEITGEIE